MCMGDFGYIYGYALFAVLFVGTIIGWFVGYYERKQEEPPKIQKLVDDWKKELKF